MHNIAERRSWIRPFRGVHPCKVVKMMADIREKRIPYKLRPTDDIENLMRSKSYRSATLLLDTATALAPVSSSIRFFERAGVFSSG